MTSVSLGEFSASAERMWCNLHTNIGTILIGNWYRPPDDKGNSLDSLEEELSRLGSDVIATILLGDMNVHHRRWLRHSRDDSALGSRLHDICCDAGLKQLVKDPTRGPYLLDLVLSDAQELLTVRVLPEISDHRVVCIDVEVSVPSFDPIPRIVWDFSKADWNNLQRGIEHFQWKDLFNENDPDESVRAFCAQLEALVDASIPRKTLAEQHSAHPWLDEECFHAIEKKNLATGIEEKELQTRECAIFLTQKFKEYQSRLRKKIATLP